MSWQRIVSDLEKLAGCQPILQRLRALCIYSEDQRFLGNLLVFINRPQSQIEFSNWALESKHARALADLHDALQSSHSDEFRANDASLLKNRIPRDFRKNQYPAALAAVRYPYTGNPIFDQWLHRLRAYLLTRMFDALEDSVARDQYLHDVSIPLREVCDRSNEERLAWFKPLKSDAVGYDHFEASTRLLCRAEYRRLQAARTAALAANPDENPVQGQLEFYRKLAHILEGTSDWHAMTVSLPAAENPRALSEYGFAWQEPGQIEWEFTDPDEPSADGLGRSARGVESVNRKPKESAFSAKRRGEKIRLRHVVDNLALAGSWYNLLPDEETALLTKIGGWLQSGDELFQLAGAIVSVALFNSSTLWEIQALTFRQDPTKDRWLDLERGELVRNAPRPYKYWKNPNPDSPCVLLNGPTLTEWRYRLDSRVLTALRRARDTENSLITTVEDLWKSHGNQELTAWFDTQMSADPQLARLSHPCTAHLVQVHAFRKTQDYSFAQLLSADQRTPLPASASYGAFTSAEVQSALETVNRSPLATVVAPTSDTPGNAAGSNIDLLLGVMAGQIVRYHDELLAMEQRSDPIRFHNKLTGYVVLCLLACTGARPVDSPFEKLGWFDFERAIVFLADKRAGPTLGTRLCVLSSIAASVLQKYLEHLLAMADVIEPVDPVFSRQLRMLAKGEQDPGLPLLLFLSEDPGPCWQEVSETTLDQYVGVNDGLPWNLLRHCFSTQVRRLGVHPDIRDGLLAHADRGVEPYGEFSARVVCEDLASVRSHIEELQCRLGFAGLGHFHTTPMDYVAPFATPTDPVAKAFGQAAREVKRRADRLSVREAVKAEVKEALGDLPPKDLSPEQSDELVRKVLFRGKLPRSNAALRLECLELVLDEWELSVEKLPSKRSYSAFKPSRATFTESVITAKATLDRVRQALDEETVRAVGTNPSIVELSYLLVMELVLGSRVGVVAALRAVLLQQSQSWQLVKFDERYWFEWAPSGEWVDGKPVFRVQISDQAATFALQLRKNERQRDKFPQLPSAFGPVCRACGRDTDSGEVLLKVLTDLRVQQNAYELPGFLAHHLAGQRMASALPHRDWIRLLRSAAPVLPATIDSTLDASDDEDGFNLQTLLPKRQPQTADAESLEPTQRCKKLFDQIDTALKESKMKEKGRAPNSESKVHAIDIANAAARAAATSAFSPGDAPLELILFVRHLATRPSKKGNRDKLRAVTIERYWYALRDPFLAVMSDINLLDLDEEEFGDLYADLLAYWPEEDKRQQANGKPSKPGKSPADQILRTYEQLPEFHEFLQKRFDLPEADWSAIEQDLPNKSRGRPGYVSEKEYLAALKLMAGNLNLRPVDPNTLQALFVMVLCYRWGLRIGEPLGLRRCDVINFGSSICIAVQGNRRRTLKNPPSRRVVPELYELTDLEIQVIESTLHEWLVRGQKGISTPLFPEVTQATFRSVRSRVGRIITTYLRAITRSNSTTHTLRHSYAMRTAQFVLARPLNSAEILDEVTCSHARRTSLNSDLVDRRALWGVARLLGHVSPASTILSYLNCLDLWTPTQITPDVRVKVAVAKHGDVLIDLDLVPLDSTYLESPVDLPGVDDAAEVSLANGQHTLIAMMDYLIASQHALQGRVNVDAKKGSKNFENILGQSFAKVAERLPPSKTRYGAYVLLESISRQRLAHLRQLAVQRLELASDMKCHSDLWIENIGASQQLLLFKKVHFEILSELVKKLGLGASDLHLVHSATIDQELQSWAEKFGLPEFLTPADQIPTGDTNFVKRFQFDTAHSSDKRQKFQHRIAVVPARSGQLKCRQELLLFWILWNISLGSSLKMQV